MHISELFQFYILAEKSVNHSQLIQTTHENTKSPDGDIPFVVVCSAFICFEIVLGFFVFTISELSKVNQNKIVIFTINYFQKYPCRRCRFFNDNGYLKCAVHPYHALTKQAFNCSDYWSK